MWISDGQCEWIWRVNTVVVCKKRETDGGPQRRSREEKRKGVGAGDSDNRENEDEV